MIRAVLALAIAGPVAGAAGCGATTPSHVAQGEAFATGNSAFDDFFTAVRDLRGEALAASGDEQSSHGALVGALGLASTSTPAAMLEEAGQRAKKLQEKGVVVHLELAPEARLLSSKGKDLGADGEALLKAIEASAKASLDLSKRLSAMPARAAELEKRRLALRDEAGATFHDENSAKRGEILAELSAASTVLADAALTASRSAGDAARFAIDLAQSVETAGGATLDQSRLAHGKAGKTPAKQPAAALPKAPPGPRPAATAAAPPPKKKPKGGGDDFEP